MYQIHTQRNRDFDKKLEEIEKKRRELKELREALRNSYHRESSDSEHQSDLRLAKARNTKLITEVQQEMSRLRTLKVSPLVTRLHHLRDEYLVS